MQESIIAKLQASRKELLDLGLRNPLLHYRQPASKGLHIIQERSEDVYRLLVKEGRSMTFVHAPEKEQPAADSIETNGTEAEAAFTDTKLQTAERAAALQHKLLNTFYAARTSIEEQGVNILYIALGMLNWYESDSSSEERRAPLLLVPVALERSSAREKFKLRYTLEEVGENLSLQAKLQTDFNISLPSLPDEEDISITQYFKDVEDAINGQKRWRVEMNAIELGFFSFSKFMIYNDLDNSLWPDDAKPVAHPIMQSLFGAGFTDPQPAAGEDAFIDNETEAHRLYQVVDADSSQISAMLAVHEGRNLVIQGPPGTGKSQTITNIIANAIGHQKKVLFVAEKLAALEVVKRRLDAIHLGEACLELHSHKANKRELHSELRRVMELGKPALQHLEEQVALLDQHKKELNDYCFAVNTEIQNSHLSAHALIGLLLQLEQKAKGIVMPKVPLPHIERWNATHFQRAEALAGRIEARLKDIGVPGAALFWGSELRVLLPQEQEALHQLLVDAAGAVADLEKEAAAIAAAIGMAPPHNREEGLYLLNIVQLLSNAPNLQGLVVHNEAWQLQPQDIEALLQAGERLAQLYRQYEAVLIPEAWEQPVLALRQELVENGNKWYKFAIGAYNKANKTLKGLCKGALPKDNAIKLQYIDAILEARRLKETLKEGEALAIAVFGRKWQKEKSDFETLQPATQYVTALNGQIAKGEVPLAALAYLHKNEKPELAKGYAALLLSKINHHGRLLQMVTEKLALNETVRFPGSTLLHQPFIEQAALLQQWTGGLAGIHQMISWNNLVDTASDEQLQSLAEVAAHWPEAAHHLTTALQKTWYDYLLEKALHTLAPLRKFESNTHEEVAQQFRRLDVLNLQYNRARVALKHWEAVPKGEAGGQVNVIRTEFNKKARHLPIRKLMIEAGLAIQAIKPVLMMSPLSIANFLPPGALEFDLVIFDEASQVRPVEALGALMRGKQLVVVGDAKQLPPTSFFDSLTREVEDEENITADLPSILGMCDAQGAPQRMLRWHYRSRHQSLIALSNHAFYDNRLVVFPSPGSGQNMGLVMHHLSETIYDRGKTRTNAAEAETVADAVMEHARKHTSLSLGVVAFSAAQQQAILEALELRRSSNPALETFFKNSKGEPFFVKNLENVQGDERDVIFISVGYGKTADGSTSMSFGPLNNEGGEKRLNVLITRAKLRCEVFTNITAADLDTTRSKSGGIKALKSFLHFAQHGQLDVPAAAGLPAQSPFEEAVATSLIHAGYKVHRQVGSKGFYIDLAIEDPEHPGRYLLGIECDGATYHAARSARDRDRLRQQVLEAMGWKLHRIWSTDWFRNPERELKRVADVINKAWKNALENEEEEPETVTDTSLIREEAHKRNNQLQPYQLAQLPAEIAAHEMHQHSVGKLAQWVEVVVLTEGPVHVEEVARRMVEAAGITRIGPRIRDHIKLATRFAEGSGRIQQRGEFLWHTLTVQPPLRDRSQLPAVSRKLKYVAPEEIRGVVQKAVREAVAIHPEALFPVVARLLGFSRVTEDMRNDILVIVQEAVDAGLLQQDGVLLRSE